MPILETVSTALEIIKKGLEIAEKIKSLTEGDKAKSVEIDRLMGQILLIREEMQEIGNKILNAIAESRQLTILLEINRLVSKAINALNNLQQFRDHGDPAQKNSALDNSDEAATALSGAFSSINDPAACIGPLIFVVNARLQILRELQPNFYKEGTYSPQIKSYAQLLYESADGIAQTISSSPRNRIHETVDKKCEYDPETGSRDCEVVGRNFSYTNLTGTVHFFVSVGGSAEEREQGTRQALAAQGAGIADDVESLGVNNLRKIARSWEITSSVAAAQSLTRKVLQRNMTEVETVTLLRRRDLDRLDYRQVLWKLTQTDEFHQRFVAPMGDRHAEIVDQAYQRLFDSSAAPEQSNLLVDLIKHHGFNALVAALLSSDEYFERYGNDLPRSHKDGEDHPKEAKKRNVISTLDVFQD